MKKKTTRLKNVDKIDKIDLTAGLLYKIKFFMVYGKMFFLMIHFLIEEDYELPKSTSHSLSVPLTLECVIILS